MIETKFQRFYDIAIPSGYELVTLYKKGLHEILKSGFGLSRKNIAEKGGEFYYPTLLARFKEGDTTLSLSQLRALYYGSIFQDDYDPYNTIDMKDIYAVINKENSSTKEMKDIDLELEQRFIGKF